MSLNQEKKIVFHYEKGPGFLTIYDNRPWRDGTELRMRRLTLNELQSRVYLFCDENHSFRAIRKMLLAEFQSPPNELQTEKLLDQFVEQGLMFCEGDRYLSLAVRKNPSRGQLSQAAKFEQKLEMNLPVVRQGVTLEGRSLPVLY